MTRDVISESGPVKRLQPAQPNGYETQNYPFEPAADGEVYSVPAGSPVGMITATKRLHVYTDAATNGAGTDVCVGFNEYEMVVDDAGKCWQGDASMPNELRALSYGGAVFIAGVFDPRDCPGITTQAKTSGGWETLPNGFIRKA